jgi:AbrB family looped-hinge helix DNA binding protein
MNTITLTSKGQVTLPVEIRRQLGLKEGDELIVTYHPTMRSMTIRKPMTIDELSAKVSKMITKKVKPVLNVDAYYQKHRGEDYE